MADRVPIIKGDRAAKSVQWLDRLPVNMYASIKEIQAAPAYLESFYGVNQIATGKGFDRGAIWNERLQIHYRVSGTRLINVGSTGNVLDYGYISGNSRASMPYSFNTQGVISGGRFYLHDGTDLNEVVSENLGKPIDGVWIDGYYILTDGEYLYNTDIFDETKISPLAYATAEFSPDPTLAVGKTQDNKLVAFGRYSVEYFQNVASEDFPFTRLTSRALKTGIVGTHCKVEMLGVFFILGGRKGESVTVQTLAITGDESVSTRTIDKIINSYSESQLSSAVLESFQDSDNQFLLVRLQNETLLFNYTYTKKFGIENAWTVLQHIPTSNNKMPIANGIFDPRLSKWVFGESNNNRIGFFDDETCTYFGDEIEQICYTPLVNIETASVDEIELDTIAGFVKETTTIFVSVSIDGVIFGREYTMLYGELNDHNQRLIRHGFGYVRKSISFKFRAVTASRLALSKLMVSYG
jgi:hypothetical protein